MRHARYRLYGRLDVCIYIGVSCILRTRIGMHATGSPWWPEVDPGRTKIDWYQGAGSAYRAEREAIEAEKPRYNVQYLLSYPQRRALHLAGRLAKAEPRDCDAFRRAVIAAREIGVSDHLLWARTGEEVREVLAFRASVGWSASATT